MPTGPDAFGREDGLRSDRMITDGSSNTIMILEACGQNIPWLQPRDVDVETTPPGINLPGDSPGSSRGVLSSHHFRIASVAFADGSVRSLNEQIDPQLLRALLTTNGGETVVLP